MISKTLEEFFKKEVRNQMNELADIVAAGSVKSFDEYKFITGQIAGLAYAERIFLDTLEEYNKEK
mgnify:FL=1|jgi:hypothetical protein